MGNYTIFWMFENPTRGRQARNFATNVPKTLGLKSSSEQMFSLNSRWVPLIGSFTRKLSLWRHLSILQMSPVVGSVERWLYSEAYTSLMACLHGGGGPQIGEVTCSGSPHLSCKRDQIKMRDNVDRRATPPTWGPPPPCKRALTLLKNPLGDMSGVLVSSRLF